MVTTKQRRKEIIELIEQIGLWNINQTELSKKYGVSHVMIHKDIKKILATHEVLPLRASAINMEGALKKSLMDCQKEVFKATGKNKMDWIKTQLQTIQAITEHLERFGIKPMTKIDTDQIITVKWGEDEGKDNP